MELHEVCAFCPVNCGNQGCQAFIELIEIQHEADHLITKEKDSE